MPPAPFPTGCAKNFSRRNGDNNAYWAQFQDTPVQKASNKVYDGLLKSYGDERGIQSYGMVVDLLVVYYLPLCEQA